MAKITKCVWQQVIKTGNVDNADFDIEDVLAAGKAKTEELTKKLKEMAGSSMAANFTMDGGAVGCRICKEYLASEEY